MNKTILKRTFFAVIGAAIYAIGMNLFIVPSGMYSGGFMGVGQLIRSLICHIFHITQLRIDLAGIITYIMNVPLFVLAYKKIGKRFFWKTVMVVTFQTIFLTLIPVNIIVLPNDKLASVVIGGIIIGFGVGLILSEGASGGGQDILGIYFMSMKNDFSVGKIALAINVVVYTICLIMYDAPIVIYSMIAVVISSIVTDRYHIQNVNVTAMIVTKKPDMVNKIIIHEYNRSATIIDGKGAYLDSACKIVYTVMSKYEARDLEEIMEDIDPNAFIVFSKVEHVFGNYHKHL